MEFRISPNYRESLIEPVTNQAASEPDSLQNFTQAHCKYLNLKITNLGILGTPCSLKKLS